MSIRLSSAKDLVQRYRKFASLLLLLMLTTFTFVPEAEACVSFADFNTAGAGNVDLIGCGEGTTETNLTSIDVRVPPETVAGTLLIAAISVDSVENVTAEPGWIEIEELTGGNNDTTLAIYTRIAGANEPDTFTFSWPGNERAYGFITAWEEATGVVTNRADASGNPGGPPTAPSITVNDVNNVILRIAGWDDDDQVNNLDPVIQNTPANSTAYNITQDQSSGGSASVSAAGAYHRYSVTGASDVAEFDEGPNSEQWAAISIEIVQGTPGTETPGLARTNLCPSGVDLNLGGPLVFYEQCTEYHGPFNDTSVPIDTPDQTAINDWMVAVINTDGARTVTAPAGWVEISDVGAGAISQAIFIKRIEAGEAATQTFTTSAADHRYGYIMRFSGASGSYVATATSDGTNDTPVTPDLDIRVSNTLALYLATVDDDDLDVDSEPIIPADATIDAITKDGARLSGGDISGIAGYENIASKATNTGTQTMTILRNEEWRTITLGIEPIEFRYSMPDSESSICAVQRITLQATDGDGNPLTWFTGTVTLSATNSTNAVWLDVTGDNVNAFSGSGASTSYTFAAGDGGELVFDYFNPDVGSVVDFDVSFGSYGESDNDNYTPPASLNIIDCEFTFSHASLTDQLGTCGVESISISLVDVNGNAANYFTGTMTINDNFTIGGGNYSLNTGSGAFSNGTADDGVATYDFAITPDAGSNLVILDYTNINPGVYDFTLTEDNPDVVITDDDDDALQDPPLTVLFCEIRLVYPAGNTDLTSDTCSIHSLTIQIVDEAGALVTDYSGTITVTSSTTTGTWSEIDAVNSVVDITNGNITYTFDGTPVTGDGGDIVLGFNQESAVPATVDFNITENVFAGYFHPTSGVYDQDLDIVGCTVDIQIAATTGVCAVGETMTVTIRDRDGNAAVDFDGEIEITANLVPGPGVGSGDYALTPGGAGGNGILTDTTPDDGIVRYDFDPGGGDAGVVEIDFSTSTVETLLFVAASTGTVALTMDIGSANQLDVQNCEVRISVADTTSDVCSIVLVTFEVYSGASVFTNFDGLLNLDVNGGLLPTGDWAIGSEPGTLDNTVGGTGNGQATYQFNGTEGGNITLEYRTLTVQTGVGNELNFDVSGTDLTESVTSDPDVDIAACALTITTPDANSADVCESGIRVVYTITDRDGAAANDFLGLVVLQTDGAPAIGDYTLLDGLGTFDNLAANDGVATYQFVAGDDNEFEVTYTVSVAGAVDLTAASSGLTVDNTDASLTFGECQFLIAFIDATPGSTDVCSTETVRITIADSGGTPVSGYNGTISLSTNSGDGTWAVLNAEGTLFDPTPEDGSASYTFQDDGAGPDPDDLGVIELTFTHAASNNAAVNINVSDGTTTDLGLPGDPDDPNLAVNLCTFQISYDGGATNNNVSKTACEVQQVTIGVYRSVGEGGGLATDYTGLVNLSTSTNNGNWSIGTATGILNDTPGDDDGAADYTFNGIGDGGEITLDFTNLNTETMTVDLNDEVGGFAGVIVEDGATDPELEITSCIPQVAAQSCAVGGSPLLIPGIPIDAQAADTNLQGRMIVVATMHEINGVSGTTDVTSVELDRDLTAGTDFAAFAELIESRAFNGNELIGNLFSMREATGLPTAAGSYEITVTHTDDDTLSACAFYLTDVEQVTITQAAPPDTGPLNETVTLDNPGTGISTSTTITTSQNNALVLSIGGQGTNGGDWDDVSPTPPLTRLFNGPDPGGSTFGGSSGNISSAAAVTVEEIETGSTFRTVHMVAAFNPLITGPPEAVGYVPVTLFETYSGNISYLAVGASTRLSNNSSACNIGSSATARLDLPETDERLLANYTDDNQLVDDVDSTVVVAYLYWFGAGDTENPPVGETFEEVTFIDPSLTATVITADEVFDIENVGINNNLDYYAAYKDVTPLVTGSGVYEVQNLDNDDGEPWVSEGGVCAGGFALIVVYDNPFEQLRVINLFHGFQPFQDSAFTLIPRNFRMAIPAATGEVPNGLVTHVTLEGDNDIFNGDESLKIQDVPGGNDPNLYRELFTDYNPSGAEFNSTITRPVFELIELNPGAGDWFYQWDDDAAGVGPNGRDRFGGYEIDFSGPDSPPLGAGDEPGASWGVDIDTHYVSGDENANGDLLTNPPFEDAAAPFDENVLYPFAISSEEEITTRYSSGTDLVMLVSEVISVVNAPIADLEVFISETSASTPPYQVNNTGTYQVVVTNNGNGASSFGSANGNITLTGVMPTGYSFALETDVDDSNNWDCTTNTPTDPGAFICTYDITAQHGGDGLDEGDPTTQPLNFTVTIDGPPTVFPSLNNDAKVIVRMQHDNGLCVGGLPGVMPDPLGCEAPEFDNVNDLQGGTIDIDDLDDKTGNNNNVDSITTNVKGFETDLAITKVLADTLEPAGNANYTITITNNGPDDIVAGLTQPTITVTDTEPGFIDFLSVTPENPADWTCSVLAGSFTCDFDQNGTLADGASTFITLNVNVTGSTGQLVSNTASVSSGLYNFDIVSGNNSDTDNSTIQDPPAAATERFLLSVSTDGTTLGGLTFDRGDLIVYDPILDTAEMFLDNDVEGYSLNDINAVHLLPNGQVILSAASASSIGTGGELLNFDANDLVLYDPLTKQTSLFYDGGSQPETDVVGLDIDAVYVLNNGNFVFSTAEDNGANWDAEDLVLWDGATFSLYLDGSDPEIFDSSLANTNKVDAAYIRVDPTDATQVIDTFIISSNIEATVVAQDNGFFGQDDVIEVTVDDNLNPTTTSSDNLFAGNVPIGVFSPVAGGRRINALHVLEDGYLGAFAITESQAGTACEAGMITITKRLGLTSSPDTNYTGSVVITTDTMPEKGIWTIEIGNGTLDNSFGGDSNNGQALYTFDASDNGQVTLNLNVTEDPPVSDAINIDVTNGIVVEDGGADPTFNYNLVVTNVTHEDDFETASYSNNTGTTSWANDWQEVDDEGSGPSSGNVSISGGSLNFTSTPSTTNNPQASRQVDLSLFSVTETVFLNFDYTYSGVGAADDIRVLARPNDGVAFTQVAILDSLLGTNGSPTTVNIDLTTALGSPVWTDTTEISFEIISGYTLAAEFSLEDVSVTTGTTDCNIGAFHHFAIIVPPSNGLACVTSQITIEGRDINDIPVAVPALTAISLSTSTGAGTWADNLPVVGTLVEDGDLTNGQASYTFPAVDVISVSLPFNYTNPGDVAPFDPRTVNFNITGTFTEQQLPATDPDFTFDDAGIVFYNESTASQDMPFQIAGKSSLTAPSAGLTTIQLVRSVTIPGENPSVACESLLDVGETATFSFSAVCDEYSSGACPISTMSMVGSGGPVTNIPVVNSLADPLSGAVDVPLQFVAGATRDGEPNIGANLDFTYMDVGRVTLYAQFDIPLGDDIAGVLSGDVISGASETFAIRPFAFDIDFDDDRRDETALTDVTNSDSYAADSNGTAFARAGVPFSTTIKAVAYDTNDDVDQNGEPDSDANLSDNFVTPSFGEEVGETHTVILSIDTSAPGVPSSPRGGGVNGSIVVGEVFDGFEDGESFHDITIDEVGIFNMNAVLVDDMTQIATNYLELADSEGVLGRLTNFGRVYPSYFEATLDTASFIPRINQDTMCVSSSPFTYLGEQFEINIDIQAMNGLGNPTQNYIDDFAKLTSFSELDIRAIIDETGGVADFDLSSRLQNDSIATDFTNGWINGQLQLQGSMNLARQASGVEESPFTNVQIAFGPIDDNDDGVGGGNDVVLNVLDVDLDDGMTEPGTNLFKLIESHEFRYGRMLIENTFGPETEDLEIPIRIEYFDGADFVTNVDDNCTSLFFDFDAAAPRALDFVGSSYEGFSPGDTLIENNADATINVFGGFTGRTEDDNENDEDDPDRPFFTTAPDVEGDDELEGRVLIQLDLSNPALATPLDFLSYDWRGDPGELDDYDEIPDGDYSDNPRGVVEFGSYRGHDRVINWQEIYIGN